MARKVFGVGTIVRAKITFRNPDTDAVEDPVAISVAVRSPSGTVATYVYGTDAAVVKDSTGVYFVRITLSEVGTYKWKWTGTASQKAVVIYDECDSEKEAGF